MTTTEGPEQMKVTDIAIALVMTVVNVVGTSLLHGSTNLDRDVDVPGLALAAAIGIVLVLRQRRPLLMLALSAVLVTTYLLLSYPYGPVMVSLSVAVYSVGRYEPLARSAPAAVGALALVLTHLATNPASLPGLYGLIPASAFVAVPLAIGVVVRSNRETVQRERAELIRQRVSDERLRVAQEVHDVVGHGLAAIKMQADIALHLLARKPGQAEIALEAISRTSTEALDELRATLTVVRSDRLPTPGLERLPELETRMSEAGLQIRVDTIGAPRHLPAAVDLVGYRVVQESLTNVLRHSETKQATVRVGYENDAVVISVSNPSAAEPTDKAGFGIPGMRERVTSLGGEFSAGPTDDGRFEVRAAIPIGGGR
ncbi:MAG: histidine kinase [Kibdelosporangium sp.]